MRSICFVIWMTLSGNHSGPPNAIIEYDVEWYPIWHDFSTTHMHSL